MKLFVTNEYLETTKGRIADLQHRLDEIRQNKTAAYNEDTNTWHDNFAYENLTREEKRTEKQLMDAMADMNNMHVLPTDFTPAHDMVGLYCRLDLQREDINTGETREYSVTIVPLGAQNTATNMYAYNMPAVYPLIGHRRGDTVTITLPSGAYAVTILNIKPISPAN